MCFGIGYLGRNRCSSRWLHELRALRRSYALKNKLKSTMRKDYFG
jgi:hypothetical protein